MSRKKIIAIHVFFWLMVFARRELVSLDPGGLSLRPGLAAHFSAKAFLLTLGYFSIQMFAFYGASYVTGLIIQTKKLVSSLVLPVCMLLALVGYRGLLELFIFKPLLHYDNYGHNPDFSWRYFIPNVIFYYWDFVMYGVAWALFRHWQNAEKNKRAQEIESKNMQLKFLQSQLNPHFLFNTINDIYALSLKKSDKAPQALMQLSGLLRYALYDNKDTTVALQKEMGYINDYLDLQRTGYDNIFYIDQQTGGDIGAWEIPPMLLLPFVENACKHGVTDQVNNPVEIRLCAGSEKLSFAVNNRIRAAQKDAVGGIGIDNIRKRLQLLYPGKHSLRINGHGGIFRVEMEIHS